MRQVVWKYPLVSGLLVLALTFYSFHTLTISENERTTQMDNVQLSTSVSGEETTQQMSSGQRTNVFFLKAHKCASSTVQNILLRFGLERGLTFVLPGEKNYIGSPETFSADMIDESYATTSGKYNIFAHHTRYSYEGVRSVMFNDAAFVTILRHPAELFESIFEYYRFQRIFNITFEELLKSPNRIEKLNRRYFNRIGVNQMSFDLGLLEDDFDNDFKVNEFIQKIDSEFDLVMMSEWMEASLVLFADLMNWPLENVCHLKLNSRPPESKYVMSDIERQRVVDLNSADYKLYTHFLNKFRKRIKDYGEEKIKNDIEKLLVLNSKLQFRCVQGLNMKGFGHTQAYKLRDEADRVCFYAARGELQFTDYLRNEQKHKVKVIKKLETLLQNSDQIV